MPSTTFESSNNEEHALILAYIKAENDPDRKKIIIEWETLDAEDWE